MEVWFSIWWCFLITYIIEYVQVALVSYLPFAIADIPSLFLTHASSLQCYSMLLYWYSLLMADILVSLTFLFFPNYSIEILRTFWKIDVTFGANARHQVVNLEPSQIWKTLRQQQYSVKNNSHECLNIHYLLCLSVYHVQIYSSSFFLIIYVGCITYSPHPGFRSPGRGCQTT